MGAVLEGPEGIERYTCKHHTEQEAVACVSSHRPPCSGVPQDSLACRKIMVNSRVILLHHSRALFRRGTRIVFDVDDNRVYELYPLAPSPRLFAYSLSRPRKQSVAKQ